MTPALPSSNDQLPPIATDMLLELADGGDALGGFGNATASALPNLAPANLTSLAAYRKAGDNLPAEATGALLQAQASPIIAATHKTKLQSDIAAANGLELKTAEALPTESLSTIATRQQDALARYRAQAVTLNADMPRAPQFSLLR
jgi:hypothetical protein